MKYIFGMILWMRFSSSFIKMSVANCAAFVQPEQWNYIPTESSRSFFWWQISQEVTHTWPMVSILKKDGTILASRRDKIYCRTTQEGREINSVLLSTKFTSILNSINHRNSCKLLQHIVEYVKSFVNNLKRPSKERGRSLILSPKGLQYSLVYSGLYYISPKFRIEYFVECQRYQTSNISNTGHSYFDDTFPSTLLIDFAAHISNHNVLWCLHVHHVRGYQCNLW